MKGYIITNRKKGEQYCGIDATNENFIWQEIDNLTLNTKHRIIGDDNHYFEGNVSEIKDYFQWISAKSDNRVLLLFFTDELDTSLGADSSAQNELNFKFIGFDVAIIDDEYHQHVLFSPVYHELLGNNYSDFIKYSRALNEHGLFNFLNHANEYKEFREEIKEKAHYNIETAYNELELSIVKIFITEVVN